MIYYKIKLIITTTYLKLTSMIVYKNVPFFDNKGIQFCNLIKSDICDV